ncbi:PCI domain protein [Ancylostoma ceylanicum]|uniref:PCI domain protein n=1 Tax=Ancylostoma ceylanicum TaxID=53326 RepID=A0A0D6M8N3_9BILA|nr:PCI domain protein [Ancylostoma ceylanicum]
MPSRVVYSTKTPVSSSELVKTPASGDADIKKKEESIMELGNMLAKNKQTEELRKMIEQTRPFLVSLGKAKAAKLVRNLVDMCLMIDDQDGDIKAALDLQSGILHAADEKDFKTAFSYFYEAFEGYDSVDEKSLALLSLKYMLLCKVMLDVPDDVSTLLTGKLALKYSGSDLEAMRAIAAAAKKRSLADFNTAFGAYPQELQMDPVVRKHFNSLSERMLEKDLCRIIEPYSYVQIDHIASSIGIDREKVEKKLSQMILDKKFSGSLHQGDGMLIVYDVSSPDATYETALKTIHAMGEVVDALYQRASKIR